MKQPIGIFDSGLGGLTVARAIRRAIPQESLVYLGDTARVPYGTRSPETVVRYAIACAKRLLTHDVKLLVVACNTASGVALPELRASMPIPVIGVIEPGAKAGIAASRSQRIGVLATSGTVASGAYERAIHAVDDDAQIFVQSAPLLVPLAEEGWVTGEVPRLAITRYLQPFAKAKVDTIVLGCTHYPLLAEAIGQVARKLIDPDIVIVDSADATADMLLNHLTPGPTSSTIPRGDLRVLVTDRPDAFASVAGRFLGESVDTLDVEAIDL